jgi:alkylation response protein AidB-like acyl-CoA dehydrogenase
MQPWQDPSLDMTRGEFEGIAAERLASPRQSWDDPSGYDPETWKSAASAGALGVCMPEAMGGRGLSVAHAVAAFEGIGTAITDSGMLYAMASQVFGVQMPLLMMASEEVRETVVRPAISGDVSLAYAFTEEASGSDIYSTSTRAVKDGEDWVLSGAKAYITNAPMADVALVFALTGEGRSPFALSAFVVDMRSPGASYGRDFEKVGFRTVRMGELIFEDVRIPKSHVVGRPGAGLNVLTESVGWERSAVLAALLGPMRRVLGLVTDWTRTRQAYDAPIGSFQQVSARVADLVTSHKMARMAVYDIAGRLSVGGSTQPLMQDIAATKLFVTETYKQFMLDAMQPFGVRSFLYDHEIQQHVRDSLAATIWAGTSETMRNTIAKLQGLPVDA